MSDVLKDASRCCKPLMFVEHSVFVFSDIGVLRINFAVQPWKCWNDDRVQR